MTTHAMAAHSKHRYDQESRVPHAQPAKVGVHLGSALSKECLVDIGITPDAGDSMGEMAYRCNDFSRLA